MEAADMINLPASTNSRSESENNEHRDSDHGLHEVNSENCNFEVKEDKIDRESMELNEIDVINEDGRFVGETEQAKDIFDDSSVVQVSVELTETDTAVEKNLDSFKSIVSAENGYLNVQNGSPIRNQTMDVSSISGVKRARMTFDERQPSVHVIYNSLTRASKQKLEQLLQQWSEWQAESGSSTQNPDQVLESGEETYFPAVRVGSEKSSAVSFWIDKQTCNKQNMAFIPLDGNTAPLYDRGYAMGLTSADGSSNLEGGLEIVDDAARCFNCGSYSHSLKECQKPRNNIAVSSARKQHKSRRNQNSGSRIPTRYYQSSAGGKYDDLKPGALGAETRQLLGLGELDPPPWLNRMREIGYPPGYLDPDDEDQPSGITIYADEDIKDEQEDGEITERDLPEPQRKMTVEFPGINAPIPENADEGLWTSWPTYDPSRSRSRHHHEQRWNHSSQPSSGGRHHEQRWFGDFRDDGPPGVDPVYTPSMSSYPPRYDGHDSGYSSYSPRDYNPRPRSPTLERSRSERGKRSPLVYEDFVSQGSYSSSPYASSNRHASPKDYGSARFENEIYESRDDRNLGSSSRDDYDRYRHRSRR